jgi:hypothetical protein
VTPQRSSPQPIPFWDARAIAAAREVPEPLQAEARGGVVGKGDSVGRLYLVIGIRTVGARQRACQGR